MVQAGVCKSGCYNLCEWVLQIYASPTNVHKDGRVYLTICQRDWKYESLAKCLRAYCKYWAILS